MKQKLKNTIYKIINPNYIYYINYYHVSDNELSEIFRIMELLHKRSEFYKGEFIDISLLNNNLFIELCSIKDKSYLWLIDKYLIDYCYKVEDINTFSIIRLLKQFVDYQNNGDMIYRNTSKYLWCNYIVKKDSKINNQELRYLVDTYINFHPNIPDRIYIRCLKRLILLLMAYLYMNKDKLDIYKFDDIINIMVSDNFYNQMILNGTFNISDAPCVENNLNEEMYYINKAINNIPNKKLIK